MLLIENCVKCLHLLVTYGWRTKLSPELVQQILSLLVFLIDRAPGSQEKVHVPEETVLEAFRTQATLLHNAVISPNATSALAEPANLPALGHAVTVMLDGCVNGSNSLIQLEAMHALQGLYLSLRDQEALANFLPGVISSLVKILSLPHHHKTAVLTRGLETVQLVLTRVLGDIRTRSILASEMTSPEGDSKDEVSDQVTASSKDGKDRNLLSPAWLRSTSSQVMLALCTILKLRKHDSEPVRHALERLCISLLDECYSTLSNCRTILVECATILDGGRLETAHTTLSDLVGIYPELAEVIKEIVYNWLSSLPSTLQLGDDVSKQNAVHNITNGLTVLQNRGIRSTTLEEFLSMRLKDSLVFLEKSNPLKVEPATHLELSEGKPTTDVLALQSQLPPVIMASPGQRELRGELARLLDYIGPILQELVAAKMMTYVYGSSSTDQVVAMWLCYEIVKNAMTSPLFPDSILDMPSLTGSPNSMEVIFNNLYKFSVQLLNYRTFEDPGDWRLEAISLEVCAFAAHRAGPSFRPELIDVLFAVTNLLGSNVPALQQRAMAALNEFASACQYESVADLIVGNVDYMVNSVAARLNMADISPASTQVLSMMIKLTGPRLIPYLDDVLESIFSALSVYNGYTSFVEGMFSVLKEIVIQASQKENRLLTERERAAVDHTKKPGCKYGFNGSLVEFLDKRAERKAREAAEDAAGGTIEGHPSAPWTSNNATEGGAKETEAMDVGEGDDEANADEKPANSPTYQLLVRIALLTQHYLTSSSPTLRRMLLELLTMASSVLAGDEDSFLPLVNALWPVVIHRLYDGEAYVSVEACHTLAGLCKAAGDFLSSRFKTEWWARLGGWCRRCKQQASETNRHRRLERRVDDEGDKILIPVRSADGTLSEMRRSETGTTMSSGSLGSHASPSKVWEAVVELLTTLVSHVEVEDRMFDQILDLLSDVLETRPEVREALDTINADAVWLKRYECGYIEPLPTPTAEGVKFVDMPPPRRLREGERQ